MEVPRENGRVVLSYRVATLPYLVDDVPHGMLRCDGVEVYMELASPNHNDAPVQMRQRFYNFGYCNEIEMFYDNPCVPNYPSANACQARHFVEDACIYVAARVMDHIWRFPYKSAAIRFITKIDRIVGAPDRPPKLISGEDLQALPDRNAAEGHVRNIILNIPSENNLQEDGDYVIFFMLTCT